jgi:short-subunit dehydrogenase
VVPAEASSTHSRRRGLDLFLAARDGDPLAVVADEVARKYGVCCQRRSADFGEPGAESWWARLRHRGLFLTLATIVAAIIAVLVLASG